MKSIMEKNVEIKDMFSSMIKVNIIYINCCNISIEDQINHTDLDKNSNFFQVIELY